MMRRTKIIYLVLVGLWILLAACNPSPTAIPEKATAKPQSFKNTTVSLTFDDGDSDNYTVREALARNNLHATFYVVSGFTGKDGFMTVSQLRDLYTDGNEIGGHTLDHAKLLNLDNATMRREVCQNRLDLLALGFDVRSFAYPFGYYDEQAKQVVKDCGYNSARTVSGGPDSIPPEDPFALKAFPYIVADTRLPKMIRYVTQAENSGGGWVIFIFHHVCDNCDKFSVAPETFTEFANWLGEQQANGLVIKTVGEVVGGETRPGINP